jgi:aldehyde dehydrogenase (NAD+)
MREAKIEWANKWLQEEKKNYINGSFTTGEGKDFSVTNPATGRELGTYKCSSSSDVDNAVIAAQAAQKGEWATMPRAQRAETLRQIGRAIKSVEVEIATVEAYANGKLYKEALNDDLPDSSSIFEYYAGWIDKHYGESMPVDEGFINYTRNEPVGVCGLIVPWNFPLLMACWKIAPALAMGNSIIIKPSEHTPYSLLRAVEEIVKQVDLPKGVFNLLLGDGEVGGLMSSHQGINKISFTGSTDVGRKIVQSSSESNLKGISLELGGKSPNIFFDDVPDLQAAIDRQYGAMFSHKGEKCSEPTRLLVHDSIYDKVVSFLASKAEAIKCGAQFDDTAEQGAQCNKAQFEKIMKYIDYGKEDGAKLVVGGTRDTSGDNGEGYFIRPTIFADVDNKIRIAQEEIFGPVLTITRFKTEEEAVAIANDTPYGLAAGFYTSNVSRAHRVAAQLDAGMVFVNQYGCYDFASPFGGFKQSGWGKDMAMASLKAYTKSKSVWIKL